MGAVVDRRHLLDRHHDKAMTTATATDSTPRDFAACRWCAGPFDAKTVGGNRKSFCSLQCKAEFHRSLREWAQKALDAGNITLDDLRSGQNPSYTARTARAERKVAILRCGAKGHLRFRSVAWPA